MESIGFGSRAVGDGTLEGICLEEEDETTVTVAEVLAGASAHHASTNANVYENANSNQISIPS
jgi:hypothetical protein